MSKHIVVFGAGKSATCLIDYMIAEAAIHHWRVTIADTDLALAQSKAGVHEHATAVSIDVANEQARNTLLQTADIVISLLPPTLHFQVAQGCVQFDKHLLTASYTDEKIKSLQASIEGKQLLFLCEMGLDPGIDHMSAMQLIHRIKNDGGEITSFYSHCGGLVAPESDDNPWHYKISWNPRNVVMAGKAGAIYRQDNAIKEMNYENLFDEKRVIEVPGIGALAWYPNRDSLAYIPVYDLDTAASFVRTTLRYPPFCYGWKQIIDLQLTDEHTFYETEGMTLQAFFQQYLQLNKAVIAAKKINVTAGLFKEQLDWLGLDDNTTFINKGRCSAMDILQFALEKKLVLQHEDKDMIVMLHEIDYLQNGKKMRAKSHLIVKGDNHLRTAMAKTVGLPLGIAAKLILTEKINVRGLHIPVIPAIYEPVLAELQQHGIAFEEQTSTSL